MAIETSWNLLQIIGELAMKPSRGDNIKEAFLWLVYVIY
jgi:hypothetical protein